MKKKSSSWFFYAILAIVICVFLLLNLPELIQGFMNSYNLVIK
ncbi:hypothetical protein [Sphingobacterium sp.]|nr:hypothetical protein [Sphingobacterium sp.]